MKMLTANEVFIYTKDRDLLFLKDHAALAKIQTPEVEEAMLKQIQNGNLILLAGFQSVQLDLIHN